MKKRTWRLYKISYEIRTPNPDLNWVKYEGTVLWVRFRFFISARYLSMKCLVKVVSDVCCTNTINYCSNHIWCAFPCRPQKAHVSPRSSRNDKCVTNKLWNQRPRFLYLTCYMIYLFLTSWFIVCFVPLARRLSPLHDTISSTVV